MHAYLNYANIAWARTHKTKLKKAQSKQKHVLRIIFNQSKTLPSEPIFLNLNVLNIYQINIFQSVQNLCIKLKKKCSAYLPKTIWCTMPCVSHQFLLNKLLSTTNIPISTMNIPKNYTVCNIS